MALHRLRKGVVMDELTMGILGALAILVVNLMLLTLVQP